MAATVPERASFFAVVAAIVKPQLGILVPIVAIVLLRRHVYDQFRPAAVTAAEEDPATLLPSGASRDPWFDRLGGGPIRLVSSAAVALVTAVVLCLPFGLSLGGLLELVAKAAGGYPYITVNAYNPWALLSQDGNGLAANGTWLRDAAGATADQVRDARRGPSRGLRGDGPAPGRDRRRLSRRRALESAGNADDRRGQASPSASSSTSVVCWSSP